MHRQTGKTTFLDIKKTFGEVAEWSIAPVLKTDVLRGTGGSNPSLSARNKRTEVLLFCFIASRELAHGLDREQKAQRKKLRDFIFRTPLRNQKPTFKSNHNETASITRREQPQRGLRPMDVITDAYGNAHKDIRHNTCCKEKPTERA